jgi:hemolysin III
MQRLGKFIKNEENLNSVTHLIGLGMSIVGLVFLIRSAVQSGNKVRVVSFAIFGCSLIVLYGASFLYHSIKSKRRKHIAEILDHSAIYFLIAGTYTPFTLISLRGVWGRSLFISIWSLAIAGTVFKVFFVNRFKVFSTIIYLVMGWIVIIAINPLVRSVPANGIRLLVAGGIIYSAGVIFYSWKNLPFHHALWHLFVIGGSIAHYFAILLYV